MNPFPWHLFETEQTDEQPTVTVPEARYRQCEDMALHFVDLSSEIAARCGWDMRGETFLEAVARCVVPKPTDTRHLIERLARAEEILAATQRQDKVLGEYVPQEIAAFLADGK